MNSRTHAFFLHSGAYSSFVLTTEPRAEDDFEGSIFAPMEEGSLWGSDCVQLTRSTVFFGVGSDAVNQALWIYLDTSGKTDPPDRELNATFSSRGEQVYLESLIDMTCGARCDQFFLPQGEHEVRFLSWNLEDARDNFDANPALFLENTHHELHFVSAADYQALRQIVPDEGADRHALD